MNKTCPTSTASIANACSNLNSNTIKAVKDPAFKHGPCKTSDCSGMLEHVNSGAINFTRPNLTSQMKPTSFCKTPQLMKKTKKAENGKPASTLRDVSYLDFFSDFPNHDRAPKDPIGDSWAYDRPEVTK